jgi:hypothetical protein
MISINSAGYAIPAADTASTKVVGRADEGITAVTDRSAKLDVSRGVVRWATTNLTIANIGAFAYVADDSSVTDAASVANDIIAGTIVDVDSLGVWVDNSARGAEGATSLASLSVAGNADITGNATVGGTLAVTGVATLTAQPVFTVLQAITGTPVVGVENIPEGYAATNSTTLSIKIGTNSYVLPAFRVP